MKALEVLDPGPLTSVQDLGRPGLASLGVGAAGAADRSALRLANRLVGNPDGAAGLEITLGGLAVRARGHLTVAATGAQCAITVAGRPVAMHTVLHIPDGAELRLGVPPAGVRTYLALRGGVDVVPVLGSRSTDLLAGLGPERLASGAVLPAGEPPPDWPLVDSAPATPPTAGDVSLRLLPGPRDDWFSAEALEVLVREPYEVTAESNRIGMRLRGPALDRVRDGELPSEGMVAGALQVPPSGQPTLFLADHPVTGGYPVIAVVVDADLDLAAQARPGQRLRFRVHPASRSGATVTGSVCAQW